MRNKKLATVPQVSKESMSSELMLIDSKYKMNPIEIIQQKQFKHRIANKSKEEVVEIINTFKKINKKKKKRRQKSNSKDPVEFKLPQLLQNIKKRSKQKSLNIKNQDNHQEQKKQHKRQLTQNYREQCQNRDKQKHPFKYKIVAQQAGLKDGIIYEMKQGEVRQIQEEYMKQLGLQYLQQGKNYIKRSQSLKCPNFKSYIHQIFKQNHTPKQSPNRAISRTDRQLKECEQMQGKIVFQRVKRHLKENKQRQSYVHRVHTQGGIDNALVDFMKLKIKRAQSRLEK